MKDKFRRLLVKNNIIKDTFVEEAFIYIKNGVPTKEITGCIKNLGIFRAHCYYKEKDKQAFDHFNEKYPEYKGYIMLW